MGKMKGKHSNSLKNEQRPAKKQRNIYVLLSRAFPPISVACLVVAGILDWLPLPYCCPGVEVFFTYTDYSPYVSTSLVIWTFGASLLVYFMGKMDDRCFGIRYHEVLLAHEQTYKLVGKLVVFLAEIVLMEIVATCRLPITLFTVSMFQLLNIIFIFQMVTRETSQSNVKDTIKEQNKKVIERLVNHAKKMDQTSCTRLQELEKHIDEENGKWLLIKAMRGLNYNRYEDMDCLLDCLSPQQWTLLDKYSDLKLILSWKLGCLLLENGITGETTGIPAALNNLLIAVAANPEYSIEFKEGLLAALAVRGDSWDCNERFWGMLKRMENSQQGRIIDWSCGLLRELVADGTYTWKTQLLCSLETCGIDYFCDPYHVLEPDQKELLDAFLDYLNGMAKPKTGPIHIDSSIREAVVDHA